MAFRRFQLEDPVRESGGRHRDALETAQSIALGIPSRYKTLRSRARNTLVFDLQKQLYYIIYSVLTTGRMPGGPPNFRAGDGDPVVDLNDAVFDVYRQANLNFLHPYYPEEASNRLAYATCRQLEDIMEDVLNKLLPSQFGTEATNRIKARTSARMAGGEGV
jgi:hypothetical protein